MNCITKCNVSFPLYSKFKVKINRNFLSVYIENVANKKSPIFHNLWKLHQERSLKLRI